MKKGSLKKTKKLVKTIEELKKIIRTSYSNHTPISNTFLKKVEEFRIHYKTMYGVDIDDETLYFFVRVNEMQIQIEKKIGNMPKITFRTGWDYFLYGLGCTVKSTWLIIAFCLLIFIVNWKCH